MKDYGGLESSCNREDAIEQRRVPGTEERTLNKGE